MEPFDIREGLDMVTIREMEIDDLDQVAQIEKDTFSLPWSKIGFLNGMKMDGSCFLVAIQNDQIVGYIGMYTSFDEGEITNVAVTKKCQNQGIGKVLVNESLKWCEKKKIQQLILEVRESNKGAIFLYQELGFEQIGSRKGFYEQPIEDGLVMKLNWERWKDVQC